MLQPFPDFEINFAPWSDILVPNTVHGAQVREKEHTGWRIFQMRQHKVTSSWGLRLRIDISEPCLFSGPASLHCGFGYFMK